jgi:hypothetical protein
MALLVAALAASACGFRPGLTSDAVSYNRSVEDVSNKTLLHNVLRAADREPLHFTELAKITGTIAATFGVNFEFPFDGPLDEFSSAPSTSLRVGPTYDVAPLNAKEFMSGIMTPASPELFAYYWDQGWPEEMLLYLFVREVKLGDGAEPIVNYPAERAKFLAYVGFVKCAVDGETKLTTRTTTKRVSPLYTSVPADAVIAARKEKIELKEGPKGRWAFYVSSEKIDFQFSCPELERPKSPTADEAIVWATIARLQALSEKAKSKADEELDSAPRTITANEEARLLEQRDKGFFDGSFLREPGPDPDPSEAPARRKSPKGDEETHYLLRSPEAMIYYLGELTREQLHSSDFPMPQIKTRWRQNDELWPLFVVKQGAGHSSDVSVFRDGKRYYIPRGPGEATGSSMNCFALITQLLGLHKSRDTLPTTQTVIGVGVP